MKLTVSKLIEIQEPLQRLSTAKIEARAAFRVAICLKTLLPHASAAFEARLRVYRQFGDAQDDGSVIVPPSRMADLRAAMRPLLDEEVDVPVDPIPLALLGGVELTPADILALEPLLAE